MIVNIFNIANDFIKNELKKEPKELLNETWDKMLEIREVFINEKNDCDKKIDEYFDLEECQKIVIRNIYCNACGYQLLIPKAKTDNIDNAVLLCANCSNEIRVMDVFEKIVDEVFDPDSYERARSGYEQNIKTCPECNKDTFDESENICYYCSYEKDYIECSRCGAELSLDEQHCEDYCFYCYDQYHKLFDND
jgi:hypothetical protein